MNRNIKMFSTKTARQSNLRFCRQINVKNRFAFLAMKMAMLVHVRAKARRAAIQLHLADESAFHERIERVVNRRVRNLRHLLFRADKNFIRRRMIALLHQHVINALALRRKTEAARVQTLADVISLFHELGKSIYPPKHGWSRFRIILN